MSHYIKDDDEDDDDDDDDEEVKMLGALESLVWNPGDGLCLLKSTEGKLNDMEENLGRKFLYSNRGARSREIEE